MSDFDPLQMDERLGAAQRGVPDPVMVSRRIAKADATYRQWRDQLHDDPDCEDDPLAAHRAVSGRTLFRDLEQLGESDPLRVHLKRWVLCLTERRINARVLRGLHHARYHQGFAVHRQSVSASLASLLLNTLRHPGAAAHWGDQYLHNSHLYATLVAALWERRGELGRRWGIDGYDPNTALEPGVVAELSVVERARAWLDRTQDMAFEHRRDSWVDWTEQALARDATLDWPARLSWRTLAEWFGDSELLTSLRLSSKRLPERIGPASFLRGLERLGQEWSESLAPSDQFFVVSHDAFRLRVQVHGALFALLLVHPAFLKRRMGAASAQCAAALRPLHRSVLLESRTRAFKVLIAEAGQQGRAALREAFMAETAHRFGFQLPEAAAGAVLTPSNDCGAAFVAPMLAAAHGEQLVSAHDDDWFRNPRAVDQLRSEASLPPPLTIDVRTFERGEDTLYARLAAALG
jgi:hypothetical protein